MLRIISGQYRRRHLITPPDAEKTRPIPDRVKESLFQLLRGHFEGATVLDAFAGVGPIGLEAVSRGASKVVMVERDREVFRLLQKNVESLGCADRVELVNGDALGIGALARCPRPLHLVFFDPPYPMVRDPGTWARIKAQFESAVALLDDTGFAVLRTPWPCLSEEPEAGPAAEPEKPKKAWQRKGRRRGRDGYEEPREDEGRWLTEEEIGSAMAGGEEPVIEEPMSEEGWEDAEMLVEETGEPEGAGKVERHPVDLTMAGAVGPETHVYHGMALHLYMRKKA